MFLINSRSHRFSAAPFGFRSKSLNLLEAHLLPKLRCQFAEFLLPSSLKRLSIFSSPTSVGFRYGRTKLKLRGFSWKHIQSLRGLRRSILSLGDTLADLPTSLLRSETGTSNTRMTCNAPSPHRTWYRSRNIDLVPISYGFRPHLRGRLTLLR